MEPDFWNFHITIALNCKSQGTEKFEPFSQGTYDSQNLRYETLVTADYECMKIFRIAVMDMKVWTKEDLDLNANHL